jgi:hypothetical protein
MASKARKARYAKIHSSMSELGWDEDAYRSALFGMFGVESKTDLSLKELDQFIQMLRKRMVERGLLEPTEVKWGWGTEKYEALRGRRGPYATPDQLRLVEASWREVARNPSDEALQDFISGHAGVDHIIWLEKEDVRDVLIAIKYMAQQKGMEPPVDVDEDDGKGDKDDSEDDSERPSSGDRPPRESRSGSAAERVSLKDMTQKERVLWWLKNEGELTPAEAEKQLGIGRLAARIYDLRQEGHSIETHEREVDTRFGTSTVAHYRLNNDS